MGRHNKGTSYLELVVDNTKRKPARRHRTNRKTHDGTVSTQSGARPALRLIGLGQGNGGEALLDTGTNTASHTSVQHGVETVDAFFHPPKDVRGGLNGRRTCGSSQRPHGTGTDAACLRNRMNGRTRRPEALYDPGDGVVDRHKPDHIQKTERHNPSVQPNIRAFITSNAYPALMELGPIIARRLRRIMEVRGLGNNEWAKNAGVADGTVSTVLRGTPTKKGKPTTISIPKLDLLCRYAGVPTWAMLHEDDAVLELFLQENRELEQLASSNPAAAMVKAMAIISELHRSPPAAAKDKAS